MLPVAHGESAIILSLLVNPLINLIPVYRWIAVISQFQDQINLELGFDIVTRLPVGISCLIVTE